MWLKSRNIIFYQKSKKVITFSSYSILKFTFLLTNKFAFFIKYNQETNKQSELKYSLISLLLIIIVIAIATFILFRMKLLIFVNIIFRI